MIKIAWKVSRMKRTGIITRRLKRYERKLQSAKKLMKAKQQSRLEMNEANLSVVDVYNIQTVTLTAVNNLHTATAAALKRIETRLELIESNKDLIVYS